MSPIKIEEAGTETVWTWILLIINIVLGISHFYLYSGKGIEEGFATIMTANIAILSAIIVVCAFVVTAAGLQKLESIEEKAEEKAEETAIKTTTEILKSREFLQGLAGEMARVYNKKGEGKLPHFLFHKERDEHE